MFCIKMNMFIWLCVTQHSVNGLFVQRTQRIWQSRRAQALVKRGRVRARSRTFLIIHKRRKDRNRTKFNLLFYSHCSQSFRFLLSNMLFVCASACVSHYNCTFDAYRL